MTYEKKYKLHDQLRQYAYDFFVKVKKDFDADIDENIIPIIFFDKPCDHFSGFDKNGIPHKISAGVTLNYKKQSIIKIFDCENHPTEELEQTVRHEVIHYILWALGLKDKDNTAVFHLMCEKYDAAADEPMSVKEKELYDKYKKLTKAYSQYEKVCDYSQILAPRVNFIQLLFALGNEKTEKIFNDCYSSIMTQDFLNVIRQSSELLNKE